MFRKMMTRKNVLTVDKQLIKRPTGGGDFKK